MMGVTCRSFDGDVRKQEVVAKVLVGTVAHFGKRMM
jgi:hypothetical protein